MTSIQTRCSWYFHLPWVLAIFSTFSFLIKGRMSLYCCSYSFLTMGKISRGGSMKLRQMPMSMFWSLELVQVLICAAERQYYYYGSNQQMRIKSAGIQLQVQFNKYFNIINLSHIMLGEQKSNFYTVKDIPAADFINAFAQYLKKNNLIERPKWADFVKTSTANQLAPLDDDWIYYRVAALARKVYLRPRTGVNLLSHLYGQKYRVSSRAPRHEHASTKIIRWSLQQLEKQKIIKKDKKGDVLKINSRVISEEGRGTLNRIATEFVNSKNKK